MVTPAWYDVWAVFVLLSTYIAKTFISSFVEVSLDVSKATRPASSVVLILTRFILEGRRRLVRATSLVVSARSARTASH